MRILLTSLNRVAAPFPVFPLGMAYLADAVRAAGHAVAIHDFLYESEEALTVKAQSFKPDVVGFSLRNIDNVRADQMISYVEGLRDLGRRIRAVTGARIVVGGAGFSIFPEEILALMEADFGICSEGEQSLPLLLQQLEEGGDIQVVPGLTYWKDGAICRTPHNPLPFVPPPPFDPDPDWVHAYQERGAVFNAQSQRGCPLRCCYCTYPLIEGKRRRLRDYNRIVSELRTWQDLGVGYVFFVDSVLNTSGGHLRRLAEAILDAELRMQWGCFMRPDATSLADFRLLSEAGLKHVEFGSDSFSDKVLKAYGKSFDFATIALASKRAQEAGIHFCHFLIFGGPGETETTMEETFRRSRELPSDVFFAFPGMRVYPQTPLWHHLRERGTSLPEDLLKPHFFIEDGLSVSGITARIARQIAIDPRWLPAELPPSHRNFVAKLRARKVEGPLWEYFSVLNRLAASTTP